MQASLSNSMMQALRYALQRVSRPLAKLLIDSGITFPAFADLLREAYVDIALEDYAIDGKTPSVSRIAILTGIHRREVTKLVKRDKMMSGAPPTLSFGARVVALWCSDPLFLDAQRQPLALPRAIMPDKPSFESLVASVTKDVRPRVLLDEWLRLGVVVIDDDEKVRLRTNAFVPREGYEEKAYYFGRNLRDHISTAAHNLMGEGPPLIDRAVYEDSLSDASLKELRRYCDQRGMELLLDVHQHVRALAERDRDDNHAKRRMTFGVYLFTDPLDGMTTGIAEKNDSSPEKKDTSNHGE